MVYQWKRVVILASLYGDIEDATFCFLSYISHNVNLFHISPPEREREEEMEGDLASRKASKIDNVFTARLKFLSPSSFPVHWLVMMN